MGSSNTINQQAKLNKAFQDYINQQTVALDAMIKTGQDEIAVLIDKHYKDNNINDAKALTLGTYQHLTTVSEWNLNSVMAVLTSISNAIFGKAPIPVSDPDKGNKVTVEPTTSAVVKNTAGMDELSLLIVNAAFNTINGILNTIDSNTTTSIQKQTSVKMIAPGLTLFLYVVNNEYSRTDFFSNNTIVQTGYVFDTRYSVDEAGVIGKFNVVQTYIDEQNVSRTLITKIGNAIEKLDPTSEDFDTKHAKLLTRQEALNTSVEKMQVKIDALKVVKENLQSLKS